MRVTYNTSEAAHLHGSTQDVARDDFLRLSGKPSQCPVIQLVELLLHWSNRGLSQGLVISGNASRISIKLMNFCSQAHISNLLTLPLPYKHVAICSQQAKTALHFTVIIPE